MSKTSSTSPKIPFTFFLLLFLWLPFQVNSQTQEDEQSILLKLKQDWSNPPAITSWNSSGFLPYCNWTGIICVNGSVTGISLPGMGITGKIPPVICNLQNLTDIVLSNNSIPGEFPPVLYNCSKLEILDLSQNFFVGRIPADIYRISSLRFINLGANNFTGDIPPEIGRFPDLQFLYLYQNQFNGSFPPEIGNLSNLEQLELAYNTRFVPGKLPPDFGRLKKLKYFWMADSNLIGEIPESLSNCSDLDWLDLSINSLSGKIPSGLFLLKKLTHIYLHKNRLSGEIPRSVEALNLVDFDLSGNELTGTIPEDFGELQYLNYMLLFDNQLSGGIPVSIGRIPALIELRLFNNSLTGVLPPELGRYSKLETVEVMTNKLTGNLPGNLCAGGVLDGVSAFSNNFSGELPRSLETCSSLRVLQLNKNSFSGEIPTGIWSLWNLTNLVISDNMFSGELPHKFAWNLTRLEISNNRFSGEIPSELSASKSLMVIKASNNLFSGVIPSELTFLSSLTTLFLDSNQLSGQLPSKIISWKSLTILNLNRNQLSGEIPPAIGLLPDLLDLDLSENQFSGVIPPQIGSLKLTSLNLSSNRLAGKIPPAFNNLAYESSFLNNPGLCSSSVFLNLSACRSEPLKTSKRSSRFLAIILTLAGIASVALVLLGLFAMRDYRRRKNGRDGGHWKLTSFHRLEFRESDILSNLTENNLIGSGGSGKVYCIAINHSGETVAVKRIWNSRNLDKKLEKEFEAEVRILSTIRHSNIVKLLCCISSEDSKLLVYEFMENRSLDTWLHRKKRRSASIHQAVLEWPKRLQIAVGAAQGLCYMHHDCSPPIIHRDVKSSNILLDSEFKAKIADFGLSRMLIKQGEEPDPVSTIAGSFGYMAPEYAYTTKINEKIDVYSFGVVLLELVTGREANNGDDDQMCLADWAWRHFQEGKPIFDAFDTDIREACYLEEMSLVFKLGIICTGTFPSTRPYIKDALQILLQAASLHSNGENKSRSEYDVAPLLGSTTSYLSSYKGNGHDDDDLASNI